MKREWSEYKLYVFDLDDTLYRETDYLFAAYAAIAKAAAAGTCAQQEHDYYDYLCSSFAKTGRQHLFQRFSDACNAALSIDEMLDILRRTECELQLYPEMKEIINRIFAQGKQAAVLTNGNVEQQRRKVNNLRLPQLWPRMQIIYANEIDPKPSPAALLQLMQNHEASPEETILIGDSMIDKQTALNAGTDYIQPCCLIK